MKEKDPQRLTWSLRFILITVSFCVFSWILKIIAGSPAHIALFLKIAFVSLLLAVVSYFNHLSVKLSVKKSRIG